MVDGVCYVNDIELPAGHRHGHLLGLVHDFDIWLGGDGSNIQFDRVMEFPFPAERIMLMYCADRPEACGSALINQLKATLDSQPIPYMAFRINEMGGGGALGKSIGRLLGWAAHIPRFSKIASGPFRTKLNNIATHITERDLRAAARELKGEVVKRKPNGTPWDHVHEVKDAQNGLMKVINASKEVLNNSGKSAAEKAAAQADLSRASKMLDLSEKFVPR